MNHRVSAALQTLCESPGVQSAQHQLAQAATELRFSEGLRRRWREARAETSVRCASASVRTEGARADTAWLRAQIMEGAPGVDVDAGKIAGWRNWCAQAYVVELMPGLGATSSPHWNGRQTLATLDKHVRAGNISLAALPRASEPGRPATNNEGRLQMLIELMENPQLPSLARTALVGAEIHALGLFGPASNQVARLAMRHMATATGLEPTGVAVADTYWLQNPGLFDAALGKYETHTGTAVTDWIIETARAITHGCQEGLAVSSAVLAGKIS